MFICRYVSFIDLCMQVHICMCVCVCYGYIWVDIYVYIFIIGWIYIFYVHKLIQCGVVGL
jgi:hypothetical protein